MNVEQILAGIGKQRVLIVGDVCLDRWCRYDPALAEPSRETGLPRVAVVSTEVTAGAAGTIANNLIALGAGRVAVLGSIGRDGHGEELKAALAARGIDASLLHSSAIPTFTYTKLINASTGREDLPRIDFVYAAFPKEEETALAVTLRERWKEFDVVLVSDQSETGCGVVGEAMRAALHEIGEHRIVWVDSRRRIEHFRNAILKPNVDEAQATLARIGAKNYAALLARTGAKALVITHGPDGVLIVDHAGEQWIATRGIANPVDICGAGDSFAAGASLAYEITRSLADAARFGNLIASITIMKPGTGFATPAEVLAASAAAVDSTPAR